MNVRKFLTCRSSTRPMKDSTTDVTMAPTGAWVRAFTLDSALGTTSSKDQAKISRENPTMIRKVIAIAQVSQETAMSALRPVLPDSRLAKNGTSGGAASG